MKAAKDLLPNAEIERIWERAWALKPSLFADDAGGPA